MQVPTQNVGILKITSTRWEALVGDFGIWPIIDSSFFHPGRAYRCMWMVECVTFAQGAYVMSSTPKVAEQNLPRDISDLISKYKPRKVIIFGSRARGNSSPESDHDVLIIKETSTRRMLRREEAMRGIHQTIPLDLLILTPDELEFLEREGSPFIREILDTGVVVYEQN